MLTRYSKRTTSSSSSGLLMFGRKTSARQQVSWLSRDCSAPLCYFDDLSTRTCSVWPRRQVISACSACSHAGRTVSSSPSQRCPCQSLAPLNTLSLLASCYISVASGLSGLDFPRYSGLLEGSLLQAASINGLNPLTPLSLYCVSPIRPQDCASFRLIRP